MSDPSDYVTFPREHLAQLIFSHVCYRSAGLLRDHSTPPPCLVSPIMSGLSDVSDVSDVSGYVRCGGSAVRPGMSDLSGYVRRGLGRSGAIARVG